MRVIGASNPVTVANYGIDKRLFGKSGWRWIRDYMTDGRTMKNLLRRVLKVNRRRLNGSTKYMFGVLIPRNTKQAYELDKINGNTVWTDAIAEEMEKISSFGMFEATPIRSGPPRGVSTRPAAYVFRCKMGWQT